jgi:hypothetical protein
MALRFIKKQFRKQPISHIYMTFNTECKSTEKENILIETKEKVNIDNDGCVETKIEDNVLATVSKNENTHIKSKKNNKNKNKENMFDKDKIAEVEKVIKEMQPEVKVVKADRGLIERTESSKIIITEDNRQVLID